MDQDCEISSNMHLLMKAQLIKLPILISFSPLKMNRPFLSSPQSLVKTILSAKFFSMGPHLVRLAIGMKRKLLTQTSFEREAEVNLKNSLFTQQETLNINLCISWYQTS